MDRKLTIKAYYTYRTVSQNENRQGGDIFFLSKEAYYGQLNLTGKMSKLKENDT